MIGLFQSKFENLLRINLYSIDDGYLKVANENWGNNNIFIIHLQKINYR